MADTVINSLHSLTQALARRYDVAGLTCTASRLYEAANHLRIAEQVVADESAEKLTKLDPRREAAE